MKSRITSGLLGLAAAIVFAVGTGAADDATGPANDDLVLAVPSVAADDLGTLRGGTEVVIGDVNLNLASNSTQLNGQVSGDIDTGSIMHNTLTNVRGVNSLMYNTGNNVSFSSNMQFNINMK